MDQSFLPSIWMASPCTLPHTNRMASFEKSRRFDFNSIYYKDDPHKPKLEQSPFSRPQMMLNQFRQKIKQATKSHHATDYIKKKKKEDLEEKRYQTINLKASEVTVRLYESPRQILKLKYDQNGNRSSFLQSQHSNQKQNKVSGRSLLPKQLKQLKLQHRESDNIYITSTPRTDLSKPLNFNPGPGSYIISQESQQKLMKSRLSGKSWLLGELEARSMANRSVMDDKMSRKSNEKINFNTLDHSDSFHNRKVNLLMKRVQKTNKQQLHQ